MSLTRHINCKGLIISVLMVVMVIAVVIALWPDSRPEVSGTLSPRDVSEVSRVVRASMKEQEPLLPDFSWDSIRWFPAAIRQRWSERILSIRAGDNEKVEVKTGTPRRVMTESIYHLRRTPKGWEIVETLSVGPFVGRPQPSR